MGYTYYQEPPVKEDDLSVKAVVFTGIAFLVLTLVPEYGFEVVPIWFACLLAAYNLPWP